MAAGRDGHQEIIRNAHPICRAPAPGRGLHVLFMWKTMNSDDDSHKFRGN